MLKFPFPPTTSTVVTLRALETREDANGAGGSGSRRLPGALGALPAAVQEVIHVRCCLFARWIKGSGCDLACKQAAAAPGLHHVSD
jgi:hypothetical protein